jgi:hypothetical protein
MSNYVHVQIHSRVWKYNEIDGRIIDVGEDLSYDGDGCPLVDSPIGSLLVVTFLVLM